MALALATDVERRAIDDVDANDVLGGDAADFGESVVGLAGDALSVDQHVPRSLPQAALLRGFADREAGDLAEHVQRRERLEALEILRREGARAFHRRWRRGDRSRRVLGQSRRGTHKKRHSGAAQTKPRRSTASDHRY
jgi:hypothetical protein